MRKLSAPALFAVGLLVVGAVAGLTVGVVIALDLDEDDGVATGDGDGEGDGDPARGPGTTLRPLTPDQVAVTGVAAGVTVERVKLERVDTPLQVTVAGGAGSGGATLFDVEVDGQLSQIVWDGGRPFDLQGAGLGILPHAGVNVFAAPAAITVAFPDEGVNGLVPGSYGLATPVAIGTAGLARPQDSVAFEATVESTVVFRGGATTAMLPRAMTFEGPGRVLLQGALQVRRPDGTTVAAGAVELPDGPFELTFTPRPDGSGYDVDGLLQGAVVVT